MDNAGDDRLPDWAAICLANTPARARPALESLLLLDARLARIVLSAKEPALAQIRLAWWREELVRDHIVSPPDPLLRDLLDSWNGKRDALLSVIDAWEASIDRGPMSQDDRRLFIDGNGQSFAAFAEMVGRATCASAAAVHGKCWGGAKLASLGEGTAGEAVPSLPRLPRDLRSLAIIGGLSRRALLRGGAPLFGDRLSPLAALRLALVGA